MEECGKDSHGLLHGKYKYWNCEGHLEEEANFVHGKVYGLYKFWNPNGLLWFVEYYKNTIREGESIEYEY